MKQAEILRAFESFLRGRKLKLTSQRARIFERAFATHEHFTAEQLYAWLSGEPGARVSRATVYRTLGMLLEGEFMKSMDVGRGELVYEHVLGHGHHDHMVCLGCGRIEEFHDERIEELQLEAAAKKGFELVKHDHRLIGYCKSCAGRRRKAAGARAAADKDTAGGPAKEPPAAISSKRIALSSPDN
jgi:Fur family ferric uptake transcriptional regulator